MLIGFPIFNPFRSIYNGLYIKQPNLHNKHTRIAIISLVNIKLVPVGGQMSISIGDFINEGEEKKNGASGGKCGLRSFVWYVVCTALVLLTCLFHLQWRVWTDLLWTSAGWAGSKWGHIYVSPRMGCRHRLASELCLLYIVSNDVNSAKILNKFLVRFRFIN